METATQRTYTSVNESVARLNELVCGGYINLNPRYQRGDVWSREKQERLIQSLFENYYVAPIILRRLTSVSFECLDGKQRLTALARFYENKVSVTLHDEDESDKAETYYYKDLSPRLRTVFDLKALTVIHYLHLAESDTIEVFNRVNNGVSLSTVERWIGMNPGLFEFLKGVRDSQPSNNVIQRDHRQKELNFYLRAYILDSGARPLNLIKEVLDRFVGSYKQGKEPVVEHVFHLNATEYVHFLGQHTKTRDHQMSVTTLLIGYWMYFFDMVRGPKLGSFLSQYREGKHFGPAVLDQARIALRRQS